MITGKERDAESGNDYFEARYYASSMGRFLSPDPSQGYYADPTNPQSLNFYAYVLNNPLKFIDPTGMYCYYGDTDYSSAQGQADQNDKSQWDYHSSSDECRQNGGQWTDDAYTQNGADMDGRPEYAVATNTDSGPVPDVPTDDSNGSDFAFDATGNVYSTAFTLPTFAIPGCKCFNTGKFAAALDANASASPNGGTKSLGLCGRYFGWAAAAGGANVGSHNGGDYGPYLTAAGFNAVSSQGYTPQQGDAAIFSPNAAHTYGHSAGYDGSQWVSDFFQRHGANPYRNPASAGTMTIYRSWCTCP